MFRRGGLRSSDFYHAVHVQLSLLHGTNMGPSRVCFTHSDNS